MSDAVQVRRLAPLAACALAALVVVGAVLSAVGDTREVAGPVAFAAWLVVTAVVATLIAARRPGNPVGWVLLAAAVVLALHAAAAAYVSAGHDRGMVAWLAEWLSIPGFGLLVFVPLLFPTGAVPTPRWRILGWVTAVAIAVLTVTIALRPQKMGDFGPNALGWDVGGAGLEAMGYAAGVVVNLCALGAAASLVVRMRAADPRERQQIRWLLAGVVAMLLGGLFAAVSPPLTNELSFFVAMAGLTAVPLSIGVAILEHHLWDLDRVVNRAVVYGTLTLVLGAVYIGTVVGLAGVLDRAVGLAASVAATVLVAVLVLPARDWLQRLVNRLLYGDRDDPFRAMHRLGTRLEAAVDPSDAPALVVATVSSALKLPYVAVELDSVDGPHVVAAVGTESETLDTAPIVINAELVGRLVFDASLRGKDRELLSALIRQAAPALHAARLTAELRWSRERIVVAREEERRRLRADLHDGIGSRLAGLSLGLEAVGNLLDRDPSGARQAVDELHRRSQEAVAEVREVVVGLRPPALDDLGLVGAIQARADELSAPVAVQVRSDGELDGLAAAAEVAVYRIAVEAMTNVARHAQAQRCIVTLSRTPQAVTLCVEDDGRGSATGDGPGFGLTSMRQRAAELGGTFEVVPAAPVGTVVRVTIPTEAR